MMMQNIIALFVGEIGIYMGINYKFSLIQVRSKNQSLWVLVGTAYRLKRGGSNQFSHCFKQKIKFFNKIFLY